ncbi:MAG: hypothetical protein KGK07_09870 [Chloroflexota bacterium]|nr:hypothetical protein [Chloroflexota bacterium]
MTIREDATAVLVELTKQKQFDQTQGQALADVLGMSPEQLNNAIAILEDSGYVKVHRYIGSAPFAFGSVEITPQGRYEVERAEAEAAAGPGGEPAPAPTVREMPRPVGSPYGFTDHDWEYLLGEQWSKKLVVVFGCQWESDHYDTAELTSRLRDEFTTALARTSAMGQLDLEFMALHAGYGEHQFNQIARSIIASDIAVFETSDGNPNVMIEMGVALTWGTRVHPIRQESRPKPPSDISGQTWACYRNSGAEWTDPRHFEAVVQMVELAARKKLARPLRGTAGRASAPDISDTISSLRHALVSELRQILAFIDPAKADEEYARGEYERQGMLLPSNSWLSAAAYPGVVPGNLRPALEQVYSEVELLNSLARRLEGPADAGTSKSAIASRRRVRLAPLNQKIAEVIRGLEELKTTGDGR